MPSTSKAKDNRPCGPFQKLLTSVPGGDKMSSVLLTTERYRLRKESLP